MTSLTRTAQRFFSHLHPSLSRDPLKVLLLFLIGAIPPGTAAPWPRHTIDHSSVGADGVRLADANGDGLSDIVTGWEEGGVVRLYLHPGAGRVREPWPAVTVGPARSVEDAVLVDLDRDGRLDVISACESDERSLQFHWAPSQLGDLLKPSAWQTEPLAPARGQTRWMFTLPLDIDHQRGIDFIAGSKEPHGIIGWWESPENPRRSADWKWHPLRPAGWIMSLIASDMDGDGDQDLLFSDRKGARRGCFWLERPQSVGSAWGEHPIGAVGREAMFMQQGDLDQDGQLDVVAAVRPDTLMIFYRLDPEGRNWQERRLAWPKAAGGAKAVAIGDINRDGRPDVVGSCEGAAERVGVFCWELPAGRGEGEPVFHDISGPEGTKYDLVQLVDLDGDGDLDVLTCEETENLGVIWYENP